MSYLEEDRKLAEQGNSSGQYNLGLAYFQGDVINKDLKEAESWFTKAAQQEHIEAYSALGGVYMQMENYQKSIEFYKLAVDKGSATAECILGEIYYHGLYSEFGIDKDYNKAFVLIKKAAIRILTGASNYPKAQCLLGHMYINAHGTEQNFEEGLVWLKRSAAHGYADAEATIGMVYKKGLGVKQDFNEALTWFKKAADKDHDKAQFNLGMMYFNGQGIEQNFEEGHVWLKRSAAHGYADAENKIGLMYRNGVGVEKDFDEALTWFIKAADKGNALAQYNIGNLYAIGGGRITKDFDTAFTWFKKSAEQGDDLAQSQLGLFYKDGLGVAQDDEQALYWFEKASAQGDMDSCFEAGLLHLKLESFEGAAFFLNFGKKMGNKEAEKLFNKYELSNHLKPTFNFRN